MLPFMMERSMDADDWGVFIYLFLAKAHLTALPNAL